MVIATSNDFYKKANETKEMEVHYQIDRDVNKMNPMSDSTVMKEAFKHISIHILIEMMMIVMVIMLWRF